MGDSRSLPLQGLDAIATDPPYGRGSSTRGLRVNDLIKEFLHGVPESMNHGAHLCISAPSEVELRDLACEAGFEVKEQHSAKIHRSLTRQFLIAKNR